MLNNMNFYKNDNIEEKNKYSEITYNESQEQFIIKGRGSFTIQQIIKYLCKDIDNNFLQHIETGESEIIIVHAIGNIKNDEFNIETPFKYNIDLLMKLLLLLDLYRTEKFLYDNIIMKDKVTNFILLFSNFILKIISLRNDNNCNKNINYSISIMQKINMYVTEQNNKLKNELKEIKISVCELNKTKEKVDDLNKFNNLHSPNNTNINQINDNLNKNLNMYSVLNTNKNIQQNIPNNMSNIPNNINNINNVSNDTSNSRNLQNTSNNNMSLNNSNNNLQTNNSNNNMSLNNLNNNLQTNNSNNNLQTNNSNGMLMNKNF